MNYELQQKNLRMCKSNMDSIKKPDLITNDQDLLTHIKDESIYEKLHDNFKYKIRELEQEKIILKALNEYILNNQVQPSDLIDFYLDILNSLIPVSAYVDFMLSGQYGALNEEQEEKLKIIKNTMSEIIQMKTINSIRSKTN